jgi:hypothetical protein
MPSVRPIHGVTSTDRLRPQTGRQVALTLPSDVVTIVTHLPTSREHTHKCQ